MKKDMFKSLGITVGEPELIKSSGVFSVEAHSTEGGPAVRKGMPGNPRDLLEGQLSKGFVLSISNIEKPKQYAKELDKAGEDETRDMHGESHHTDGNKIADNKVEEVDHSHAQDDIEFPAHRYMNNVKKSGSGPGSRGGKVIGKTKSGKPIYEGAHASQASYTPKDHADASKLHDAKHKEAKKELMQHPNYGHEAPYGSQNEKYNDLEEKVTHHNNMASHHHQKSKAKVMKSEDLVLKALTDLDRPLRKSKNVVFEASSSDPMDEMYKSLRKGIRKSSLIQMSEDSNDPETIANVHENSDGVAEKKKLDKADGAPPPPPPSGGPNLNPAGVASIKNAFGGKSLACEKSELQELADLVKGTAIHQIQPKPAAVQAAAKRPGFLKAMGPGGAVFDFGSRTGNVMADNASDLLNAHGDPVQAETARYQSKSYDQALADYAVKGDAGYNNTTTMFGNIDKGWSDQLNKPMDQQVAEMYKAEADHRDPSVPYLKNEFNKTELNVNGEIIKATSETDAAVLEMYKAMNTSGEITGDVADCTNGGAVKVIAGE